MAMRRKENSPPTSGGTEGIGEKTAITEKITGEVV